MARRTTFDKNAAFRSIVGVEMRDREGLPAVNATAPSQGVGRSATEAPGQGKSRVQRSYWLDKDIDKALKKKSLEEEKTLTELINQILREGVREYL